VVNSDGRFTKEENDSIQFDSMYGQKWVELLRNADPEYPAGASYIWK